jgi:hypothetical protein
MAYILLDNEGLASRNIKQGLAKAISVHSRKRRATRRSNTKIWRTSFEFENFSDTELASAMNDMAGYPRFERADLARCRASMLEGPRKGRPLYTIERLYASRMGSKLDKPNLGRLLANIMFAPTARRDPDNRPISRFLRRIGKQALLNHQPSTQEYWEINQSSGYLGTLRPAGRASKRRRNVRKQGRTGGVSGK